jgi:hypothetical protein
MKFEQVMPALREGKRMRRKGWDKGIFTLAAKSYFGEINLAIYVSDILEDDWEILEEPKKKVKYYPVLFHDKFNGYYISDLKFKSLELANRYRNSSSSVDYEVIRLVTEIPELIEERDE